MLGYPRRRNLQRRYTAPNVQFFDPSADPYCTGWWRGDSGIQLSDTRRSYLTGWTSKLPDQKTIVNNTNSAVSTYVPNLTNGFGGVYPTTGQWGLAGVAQAGDRSFTFTWVGRFLRWHGDRSLYLGMDNMLDVAIWDGCFVPYHPNGGWWWTSYQMTWNPTNGEAFVFTLQMQPRNPDDSTSKATYRGAYNTSISSSFDQTDTNWGDRTLNATHKIWFTAPSSCYVVHELITWRRYLSDTEILVNHQALLQQYGVAV